MTKQQTGKFGELLFATCISVGACLATGAVSPALAQSVPDDTWLETIIVTGSRTEERIKETPHTVTVIDKKEIENVNFVDSREELLRRIPGNSMIRNLRIPMGDKNYTVNLVDGLSVRGIGRGTNTFVDESNIMDIERVEVIRGPASALYGSNAIGGVINVITRKPPKEPEMRAWADGGSWGRRRLGVQAAGSEGPFGFFFDANTESMDGWQERNGFDRKRTSGKVTYEYGQGSTVSVRGEYLDLNDEAPGTLTQLQYNENWRQAGISDAFTHQQLYSFSTIVDHKFSDKTSFKVAYGSRYSETEGTPSYSSTGAYSRDSGETHNIVPQFQHNFDFLKTQFIAGVDFIHDATNDKTLEERLASSAVDKDQDVTGVQKSPFSQLQFWPTDWMKITLGGRYDDVEMSLDGYKNLTSTPKQVTGNRSFYNFSKDAGVTFNLNQNHSLWLSYGEGFVVPSTTALFTGGQYAADPTLDPEKATNYAIGLRGKLLDGVLGYDVSLYDTTIEDLVIGNKDCKPRACYENAGKSTFRGLETTFTYQPLNWLGFSGAYTYAQNTLEEYYTGNGVDYSGNTLQASPLHHLNARLVFTPEQLPGVRAELEWDHISEYYTSNSNEDAQYQRPDLLHARISYENEQLRLWGSIRNLTDVKYPERVTYSSDGGREFTSGEPRTFVLGAKYKF